MALSMMERLKNSRGQTAATLQKTLSTSSYQKDERIWKYGFVKHPTLKDTMWSDSTIRFLPTPFIDYRKAEAGELPEGAVLSPIVHVLRHDFAGANGAKYQENSLKTIGGQCPVSEHDAPLWNAWKEQGKPDNDFKKILLKRLPSENFYANILVIDDKANPENNGKVFLFKFGNAVKKIIDEAFTPTNPTLTPFDPLDPYTGGVLHLQFKGEERTFGSWSGLAPVEMPKYSVWEQIGTPLAPTDEAIEALMEQAYSLQDFVKPELFKSYEVLKARFEQVMGLDAEAVGGAPSTAMNAAGTASVGDAPVAGVQQGVVTGSSVVNTTMTSQSAPFTGGGDTVTDDELDAMLSGSI